MAQVVDYGTTVEKVMGSYPYGSGPQTFLKIAQAIFFILYLKPLGYCSPAVLKLCLVSNELKKLMLNWGK